ncbi:hypothetical protein FRB91_000789 [Serendipita sp. 411]|nr:hypothetical protein FRB91_000789 [Serendipita sp. 411]
MSEDPFSDPPTILISPARGRSNSGHNQPDKMEPEIQEIRIVEPRSKPSRSAAAGGKAPPVPPKKRSHSQDGVLEAAAAAEKARAAKTGQKITKKSGLHVDVIDRLDYSGVGPAREPEPYEEFFAESVSPAVVGHGESGLASAASSIHRDKEGHNGSKSNRRPNGGVRRPTNRPPLPPPQPIFPQESTADDDVVLSADMSTSPSAAPRRSKSLMQRFKKMRDAPNVPVDYDDTPSNDQSGSSSENHNGAATRPTHRTQTSVLGRPGNKSPTSPGFNGTSSGDSAGEKALPGIPPSGASPRDELGGYFDRGLGRKTSIMQKVRGVVVGKK